MRTTKLLWDRFKVRCALLTSRDLCLAPRTIGGEIHLQEISNAAASVLYINACSLLDDAIETRLTADESKRVPLGQRLKALRDRGDLLSYESLDRVVRRRNEIAHELGKDAAIEDLASACEIIEDQLAAWGLIDHKSPPYTLAFERSAIRASLAPRYHQEYDTIVRVMKGDQRVFEAKQTTRTGAGGA